MRTLKLLLPLLLAPFCFAQIGQTTIVPPCTLNFTFNATNLTSANLPNSTSACDKWTLSVYNAGFGSFTVTLQSALAATPSTPGTFGTYTGTTATGSNPLTTTGLATFTNGTVATPWLRVVFTGTGTGTVYGVLQGSQTVGSGTGGGGGGGCTSPCPVVGTAAAGSAPSGNPVQVAGSDGTNIRTLTTDNTGQLKVVSSTTATSDVSISVSASGLTQILAASGSTVITVYHISLGFASGVNFQLESGTGSNCGTGTATVTGVYQAVQGIALDVPFTLPAGAALCINLGSAVTGGGLLIYTQI